MRIRDKAVDGIDGAEIMRRWLEIPADKRYATVEDMRLHLTNVPSPDCAYQSAQEALAEMDKVMVNG